MVWTWDVLWLLKLEHAAASLVGSFLSLADHVGSNQRLLNKNRRRLPILLPWRIRESYLSRFGVCRRKHRLIKQLLLLRLNTLVWVIDGLILGLDSFSSLRSRNLRIFNIPLYLMIPSCTETGCCCRNLYWHCNIRPLIITIWHFLYCIEVLFYAFYADWGLLPYLLLRILFTLFHQILLRSCHWRYCSFFII